jgi:hypothetical protein
MHACEGVAQPAVLGTSEWQVASVFKAALGQGEGKGNQVILSGQYFGSLPCNADRHRCLTRLDF